MTDVQTIPTDDAALEPTLEQQVADDGYSDAVLAKIWQRSDELEIKQAYERDDETELHRLYAIGLTPDDVASLAEVRRLRTND